VKRMRQSSEDDRIWNDRRVHEACKQDEFNDEGGEIVTVSVQN